MENLIAPHFHFGEVCLRLSSMLYEPSSFSILIPRYLVASIPSRNKWSKIPSSQIRAQIIGFWQHQILVTQKFLDPLASGLIKSLVLKVSPSLSDDGEKSGQLDDKFCFSSAKQSLSRNIKGDPDNFLCLFFLFSPIMSLYNKCAFPEHAILIILTYLCSIISHLCTLVLSTIT